MSYHITPDEADVSWNRLNADQRHAANRIVTAIDTNTDDEIGAPGALFFLNSAGGTGKTMVQNTIMQRLRSQQKVALAVASSGIASENRSVTQLRTFTRIGCLNPPCQ